MTRVSLTIGSSDYNDSGLQPLPGATADANQIHGLLCTHEFKSYDSEKSIKLLNPTLSEVLDALSSLVLEPWPRVDVFSFYFAGHGLVVGSSFYMCLRNTVLGQLSRTALSVSQLFGILNEGQPSQTNVIIDACHSGGVVLDLPQAIKPELLRTSNSPSISLLATSLWNQSARESSRGGLGTAAILDVLDGKKPTGSTMPFLDLVAIGQQVSAAFQEDGAQQTPVVWGLNLTGTSQFARNPHGDTKSALTSLDVARVAPISNIGQKLTQRRDALWGLYLDLGKDVDIAKLSSELTSSGNLLDPGNSEVSDFVTGLSYTLPTRATQTGDRFGAPEVLACCATYLLGVVDSDPGANQSIRDIANRFVVVVREQLTELVSDLASERHSLLSATGAGTSDLILLPIRISKLLGFAAAVPIIAGYLGQPHQPRDDSTLQSLLARLLKDFEGSIAPVAELQASYLAVFFPYALASGLHEAAEKLLSLMIADFSLKKGRILKANFSGREAFQYAWQIATRQEKPESAYLARPSELFALLLLMSRRLEIQDTVDPYLHEFDHYAANIFVPANMPDYSRRKMVNGTNVTLTVGLENPSGFFTVDEFDACYRKYCVPRLLELSSSATPEQEIGAVLSALTFGNRICWHLLK